MYNLVIVGAGGLGKEVAWTVQEINRQFSELHRWNLCGFIDDNPTLRDQRLMDLPIIGNPEKSNLPHPVWFHCAIGDNARRKHLAERCLSLNWQPASLIHPTVQTADNVFIGGGVYIGAGAIINPDVRIEQFVLINQRVAIGHDAVIESFSQLNPGAQINGNCRIGSRAMIGSNASLHPGTHVGTEAVVGSNSQVVRNVSPGTTVNGVPAQTVFRKKQPRKYQ